MARPGLGHRWTVRAATQADAGAMGSLNQLFVNDGGYDNPMSLTQLQARMRGWLQQGEFQGLVAVGARGMLGYVLYQRQEDRISVRQLFVVASERRFGMGRGLVRAMAEACANAPLPLEVDVLIGNAVGRTFWRALGLDERRITLATGLDRLKL